MAFPWGQWIGLSGAEHRVYLYVQYCLFICLTQNLSYPQSIIITWLHNNNVSKCWNKYKCYKLRPNSTVHLPVMLLCKPQVLLLLLRMRYSQTWSHNSWWPHTVPWYTCSRLQCHTWMVFADLWTSPLSSCGTGRAGETWGGWGAGQSGKMTSWRVCGRSLRGRCLRGQSLPGKRGFQCR